MMLRQCMAAAVFLGYVVGAAVSAGAEEMIQVFDEPVGLFYNDPKVVAPIKSGVAAFDEDGDGVVELLARGWYWRDTGRRREDMPIYARLKKASARGPLGDLDGDGNADTVILRNDTFYWLEREKVGGKTTYKDNGPLPFVQGGPLVVPNNAGIVDVFHVWSVISLEDFDNDGLTDLLLCKQMPEMLGQDSAYVPWKYADFGVGWIDEQWIFSDDGAGIWWCRNVGTEEKPVFTFVRMVTAGHTDRLLAYPQRSVSAALIDWNEDGKTDVFVQFDDRSYVYLNVGKKKDGSPRLDNGHCIVYGDSTSIDHRKVGVPYRAADGLLHVLFHGGSVIYEAVQQDVGDYFTFGEAHWVLFENPPTMSLDIFAIPDVADLDGDGRKDLVIGSEVGFVWYMRNLDPTGGTKKWAPPAPLEADGKPIRMYKEFNLQGPVEWLIGYSNPTAEDWDLDGDLDLLVGNHGEVVYYFENVGDAKQAVFAARGALGYGPNDELPAACAWRSRPGVGDVNGDGLPDLVNVDAERKMTIWWRYRDADGKLRLSEPAHALDEDGYPFIVCRGSRGIGRSKFAVVDWDKDGLVDVITSNTQAMSARSEFVYFYKNLGQRDGTYVFEFRPCQIKVTGHIKKGKYTHCRMLEPVDWDGDGDWEAIAGMDQRHPMIGHTWIYYWDEMKTEKPTYGEMPYESHEYRLDSFEPEDYVPGEGQLAVMEPAAVSGVVDVLTDGVKLFENRDYVCNALPAELAGRKFVRGEIESSFNICKRSGKVYALISRRDGYRRDCYLEYMLSQGFRPTGIEDFVLFGSDEKNRVIVLSKELKSGEKLVLGKWAIVVFE